MITTVVVVVAVVLVVAIALAAVLPPRKPRPPQVVRLPPPGPPAHWPGFERPGCRCWTCIAQADVADYEAAERIVARNAALRELVERRIGEPSRLDQDPGPR